MKHARKMQAYAAAAGLAAVAAILGTTLSDPAGASTRPAPPNLRKPSMMELSGSNGKPIIGRDGKPVMVRVGGPVEAPSASMTAAAAAAAQRPLTEAQIRAALQAGPMTVTIPNPTDQQKVEELAPSQAPVAP